MPTPNLGDLKYIATGGTVKRSLADRAGDIIRVTEYGSIQEAFDAAFGSSGSPHGLAGATQNKPVHIPAGTYSVSSALTLTHVVGGRIFGDGSNCTKIQYTGSVPGGGTVTSLLRTNGCSDLYIEGIELAGATSGTNTNTVDLDWDGTGTGIGLAHNHFKDVLMGGTDTVVFVGRTGNEGHNNIFEGVTIIGAKVAGIHMAGAEALDNLVIGGGGSSSPTAVMYLCDQGSVHVHGGSLAGNLYDIQLSVNLPITVIGGRTEGPFLNISAGTAVVKGFGHTGVSTIHMTGGKVMCDGCFGNSSFTVTGTAGQLYVRGCAYGSGTFHSGFSGTVSQEI